MKNTFYGLMSRWTTVLSVLLVVGCTGTPTPQQTARHLIDGAGEVLVTVDQVSASEYTAHARAALAAASDLAAYRTAMLEEDAVVQALQVGMSALRVGESVVDLWDTNGELSWPRAQRCIVAAMLALRDAFAAAGYALPPALAAFVVGLTASIDIDQCSTGGV